MYAPADQQQNQGGFVAISDTATQEEWKEKESLISAWTLFLDREIVIEAGVSMENLFEPIVQIFCPANDGCYLHFDKSEWEEISSIKTEHKIRQLLQCISVGQCKHEVCLPFGIQIETLEEVDGRPIRIIKENRSILFSKQAIEALFSATDVINQKLDLVTDYTMYCLYDDFTNELARVVQTENITDDQMILTRGKFLCQNLKLLTSLIGWSRMHYAGDFSVLTEIVNIHSRKFVECVVSKSRCLQ